MPDTLIKVKGPYEVNRRLRRLEERQENWIRQSRRSKRTIKWRNQKSVLYYFVFHLCLAVFTVGYFLLVFETKSVTRKGTSLSSVPGFTVGNVKLIRYKEDQREQIGPFINQIEKCIQKYGTEGERHLRDCNLDNYWGYTTGLPCVLLKLNYALDFTANTYDDSITLPNEVPDDLYDYVLQLSVEERTNRIWAACNFMDNKTIGNIEYVPFRYYDSDGLFSKSNSYLRTISENLTDEVIKEDPAYRRVIGVQFKNLPLNQDIYVKCTVWARNIPLEFASTVFVLHVEGLKIPSQPDDDYGL